MCAHPTPVHYQRRGEKKIRWTKLSGGGERSIYFIYFRSVFLSHHERLPPQLTPFFNRQKFFFNFFLDTRKPPPTPLANREKSASFKQSKAEKIHFQCLTPWAHPLLLEQQQKKSFAISRIFFSSNFFGRVFSVVFIHNSFYVFKFIILGKNNVILPLARAKKFFFCVRERGGRADNVQMAKKFAQTTWPVEGDRKNPFLKHFQALKCPWAQFSLKFAVQGPSNCIFRPFCFVFFLKRSPNSRKWQNCDPMSFKGSF